MRCSVWLLGLALLAGDEVDLRLLHPVDGVRTLEVSLEGEAQVESSRTLVDGRPVEVPAPLTRTIEVARRTVLRDTFRDVEGERVEAFERVVERADWTSSMQMVDPYGGRHASESERRSGLVGEVLHFTREGGGFVARREGEDEGPPLEGLRATPDWSRLLPDGPLAVGAAWEVELDFLADLREPGGELDWSEAAAQEAARELHAPAGSTTYRGRIAARLEAVEDGEARIALEVDGTSELDLTPFLPEPEGGEHEGGRHRLELRSVRIAADLAGEGQVLWSLTDGAPRSLELELRADEVETVDFGHTQLAAGLGAPHDVKIEAVTESRVVERITVHLR